VTNVETYLAALPLDQRTALEDLRRIARAASPDAVEVFGYGMPGLKYRGRPLIYFGAWKGHCSIYAMGYEPINRHRAELAAFDLQKGTIHFQPEAPVPTALVTTMIHERMADIDTALARPRKRSERS
jgi:Uncharacterized conserved protein